MDEKKPLTIVLVEDDPGHAVLIEKNLKRAGVENEIVKLRDGKEAVDFLFPQGSARKGLQASPLLVLLDLNLPLVDGYQVLERIKSNADTRSVSVVVLTATDSPHEIERCYKLGCNVYVTKPVEYEQFSDAVRKLGMFLVLMKLPEAGHHG